jgi:alkanesulfonate monooxygenase SsuD/methylene tetrahydromethanopterin reductase-like flavin-dependent oxidoreductase (luciferase family)
LEVPVKCGFVIPFGDARDAANLAREAEQAGWDGFFVWDSVWGVDAAVMLAAAAMTTETIRLGTMITPVSRHRPWKLAAEWAALDNLSGGRMILSVGLGAIDTGFAAFGEVTDKRQRAELLDEGLEILTGLWAGQPFSFSGKHYTVQPTDFMNPPPPVQQPRIPIWVVGAWPRRRSMRRAVRWDGLLPSKLNDRGEHDKVMPEDIAAMRAYLVEQRGDPDLAGYDIVVEGKTAGDDSEAAAQALHPWVEAGATWWIEANWEAKAAGQVLDRIRQGPPKPQPV